MQPQKNHRSLAQSIQTAGQRFLVALFALMLATLTPVASADQVAHDVAAGNLQVDQIPNWNVPFDPFADENTNAIVTQTLSVNGFQAVAGPPFNRADYGVQIGVSGTDDSQLGILISSVAQNVRTNWGTNSYTTSMIETNSDGSYRITSCGNGFFYENNVNVAGAWFPYATWIGGHARTEPYLNGGTNYLLTGSAGLTFGTHFIDEKLNSNLGGRSTVNLTNLGIDARTDGILLVNHGKDRTGDGNYALSIVNTNNGTWTVFIHDNAANGGSYEQDPVAFVFIPKTNTTVVSGRFDGGANITMHSGPAPEFTVTSIAAGRYELKVPGRSPTNGVLIISAAGGTGFNADNIVTYQPNAANDGWEIQSRDLPAAGLQSPTGEEAVSFVYIPANLPGVTVTPTNNLLTTEAGGTAQFTVVLDAPPYHNVTIAVSSSDTSEGTPDVSSLTFTTGNWSTPQTVTITGQDDALFDGAIAYSIVLGAASSSDSRYSGMNPPDVSVVNADNEPGTTINKTGVTTTEAGGQDTFTIVLNTLPTDNVTIGLSSSDTSEGTVLPATVTFTTGDWNIPQVVTVTGVNDDVDDGDVAYSIVTAPATSTDGNYSGFNGADVAAVNLDNDTAGYTFGTTSVVVSEGGAATNVSLVLNSEPTANVTVNFLTGDATEGTVTASLVFTPGNWSTPQNFTVTPVDDFVNDGAIAYTITTSVSSGDAVYAALDPADIAATTTDNEAALTLPSGDAVYGIGDPGVGLDGRATVVDADTADYDTGSVTVTITANGDAADRLEVRNTGNGPGEIGVSGSTVNYGGTPIGTMAGGVGLTPLVITLNSSATPAATEAMIRSVTYRTTNNFPMSGTRTVSLALADGDGGTSTAGKTVQVGMLHVYNFQQGVDNGFGTYLSAADVQIRPGANSAITYPAGYGAQGMFLDEAGADDPEVLLRFTNNIGTALGQIPTNAVIVSAELVINCYDTGGGGNFFRMLIPWNPDAETWDSLAGSGNATPGVQTDGVDARATFESFWGPSTEGANSGVGSMALGVTTDVQAWVNGEANEGWMIKNWEFFSNGTGFNACENTNSVNRPRLRVAWLPPGTQSASFREGVNTYTNTFDTRIREVEPTNNFAYTNNGYFVDFASTGTNDNEQVLIRFNNIFGNATNQVPYGALIHAAALDMVAIIGAAPGDGGNFHALLQPWQDSTTTWDSWVNGIQANGVEAAATPTASVGNASLDPNAQATTHHILLTSDVQAWANGTPNYGWAILPWPNGGDGWGIASVESALLETRPQLRVYYLTLVIQSVAKTPTDATISFSGPAGMTCTVRRSGTVAGTYSPIGTATIQPNGLATFTDTTPLPGAAFYRVSLP